MMDADTQALLGRLRETWCGHSGMSERHNVNPDGPDAASTIERMADLIRRLAVMVNRGEITGETVEAVNALGECDGLAPESERLNQGDV